MPGKRSATGSGTFESRCREGLLDSLCGRSLMSLDGEVARQRLASWRLEGQKPGERRGKGASPAQNPALSSGPFAGFSEGPLAALSGCLHKLLALLE